MLTIKNWAIASILATAITTNVKAAATSGQTSTLTAANSAQPCAQVSSAVSGSDQGVRIDAELAYNCSMSVPIVFEDALALLNVVSAFVEWQSTIEILKNPPEQYPLSGTDLQAQISNLQTKLQLGLVTQEIDFEANLTNILASAHDHHLSILLDGISAFTYYRDFPDGLVSVSPDGLSAPELFLASDFVAAAAESDFSIISALVQINGVNASQWIEEQGQNVTYGNFQDPDALYNDYLFAQHSGTSASYNPGAFVVAGNFYPGPATSLSFKNGSTINSLNYAIANSAYNWTGVDDGATFYSNFCNASQKAQRVSSTKSRVAATTTTTAASVTQLQGYPIPTVISTDGALSGYFMESSGLNDTAVLVLAGMSVAASADFQSSMSDFLRLCRQEGKSKLVIDISGNPGGSVGLAYDTFQQLFPNIQPYTAQNYRGTQMLDLLGSVITEVTEGIEAKSPFNNTLFAQDGGYLPWAAEVYDDDSGTLFSSWPELYGPVMAYGENFTNLIRLNLSNTLYSEANLGIIVSGHGNMSQLESSPFSSTDIIMLSDGQCSSACTIFAHLMKWQGKVKSIAMGGRPQTGAMQALGGVKGSLLYSYAPVLETVVAIYQQADDSVLKSFNESLLQEIYKSSSYLPLRLETNGVSPEDFTFNMANSIAQGDDTYTPLQFVYEAADCHLWYQPEHLLNITNKWATVALQAFGLNNTSPYSLCVEGSINQTTSLSGNSTLYNNGIPTNVTNFISSVKSKNGAGSLGVNFPSATLFLLILAATVLCI